MSLKKLFNLPKIHLPKVSGHPIFLLANYFLLFMVKSLLFAMKISNMKSNLPEYYNQKQNWLRLGQKLLNFAVGYFGRTMPRISVKWCHFERSYNDTFF